MGKKEPQAAEPVLGVSHRTNAEIAASMAGVKCAGQPWLTVEQRKVAAEIRQAVAGDASRAKLRMLNDAIGEMAGVAGGYYRIPEDDAELPKAWLEIANGRKPCAFDLGSEQAKEPFDGREHKITCPLCGNVTVWVPPVSAEIAATLDAKVQGAIAAALTL